jgi:chitodextrinase
MNQRFQWLYFTRATGALYISAPADPNRAPPGHYLVFILDGNGVPSEGRIVKLDWVPLPGDQPDPSMVTRVTGRTDATKQYMTVRWTGVSGASVDVYRDGGVLKTVSNTGIYSTSRVSTAAGTFIFRVCRSGSTACSNSATIVFSGTTPGLIPLRITGWRDPIKQNMDLAWSGLTATTADVFRDGSKVKATSNTGRYTTSLNYLGAATYQFQVCNAGTTTCSSTATLSFDGSAPPPKVPPAARFTSSCTDLACSFTDSSTDWDGSVTRWQWTFGDGYTSSVRHPVHSYPSGGTYTVALLVTDNTLASGSTAKAVTTTDPPPP